MGQLLDVKKKEIQDLLMRNPGLYLTKIAEILDMKVIVAEQHLKDMQEAHIVRSAQEDGYKRYYIDEEKNTKYRQISIGTREEIYNIVAENPGLSLSRIAELLDMGISLARYHLNYLEKNKNVVAIKKEGYKRYYVESSNMTLNDRKLLALFRQDIPLQIVFLLLEKNSLQHKDFLEYFNIAPSTLTYHLKKLLRDGVIYSQKYGKDKGYMIKNKKTIIEFLRRYKINQMIKDFQDIWSNINFRS